MDTRLKVNERRELASAQLRGYLIYRETKDCNLFNAYWRWCKRHNRPFIRARLQRKYATISVDYFTSDIRPPDGQIIKSWECRIAEIDDTVKTLKDSGDLL